jgi:uncharacterized protein (TIGR02145 family)
MLPVLRQKSSGAEGKKNERNIMTDIKNKYVLRYRELFFIVAVALFVQCINAVSNTHENGSIYEKMTDIDGNEYKTIRIGDQTWMAANFRAKRYNDGEPICQIDELRAWAIDTIGTFCFYNNTTNNDTIARYGALYSYYTVSSQKLAPIGWRVPTKEDWEELESYLISHKFNWDESSSGNKIAKALAAKSEWDTLSEPGFVGNNLNENNASEFNAYPSGMRIYRGTREYTVPQEDNGFEMAGKECNWWTSSGYVSSAWFYSLAFCSERLQLSGTNALSAGFSIRLIKEKSK